MLTHQGTFQHSQCPGGHLVPDHIVAWASYCFKSPVRHSSQHRRALCTTTPRGPQEDQPPVAASPHLQIALSGLRSPRRWAAPDAANSLEGPPPPAPKPCSPITAADPLRVQLVPEPFTASTQMQRQSQSPRHSTAAQAQPSAPARCSVGPLGTGPISELHLQGSSVSLRCRGSPL
ncbi:hypothetical protein NDU88_010953 [Pleurodeles waltl]|uniref:Uncharacterized protein n=1 Tax=Pleurodeles waltl TaxID=8319 RepID=A0AAV7QZV6_PLEWA|nr:hypothetical protein NDU88_010953 [Pleurodeles waltl]